MKKAKFILILISILSIIYFGISWILLNGHFVYYTSFNESRIPASKKEKLFVTDKLEVISEGDSLQNWRSRFNIWTNKNYQIKYWGILFHWTSIKPQWRYLNITFKNENNYIENNTWCYKLKDEKGLTGCCNRIACNVGDTLKIDFYKCKEELKIGTLKIIVK